MINIAFVCHCDIKHGKNYFPNHKNINIQYIDPWSGCKSWKEVQNDSLDIIYTINCPIYYPYFDKRFDPRKYPKDYQEMLQEEKESIIGIMEEFRNTPIDPYMLEKFPELKRAYEYKPIMDSLFEEGFKKLKTGGEIYLPFNIHFNNKQSPANFVKYVKRKYPYIEFKARIEQNVPFDYIISWDSDWARETGQTRENSKMKSKTIKFLVITKTAYIEKFEYDFHKLGAKKFLERFLTNEQMKRGSLTGVEINVFMTLVKKAYPYVDDSTINEHLRIF